MSKSHVAPHTLDQIAAAQQKARQPTPHLTLDQAEEWTLVKAYGFPNSSITGVCVKGEPIYANGGVYVPVEWYAPGEDKPTTTYEDIEGLELAPPGTHYPDGCIPF